MTSIDQALSHIDIHLDIHFIQIYLMTLLSDKIT